MEAKKTILIVDDEDGVRRVAERMLARLGYATISAASGEEAIAIYTAGTQAIDLVIADISMPGMSGIECFHALRAFDPDVRVVLSSGFEKQQSDLPGLTGFIGKPYQLQELRTLISSILA
jgi:CheY-like chemotaxis protein